MTDYQTYHATQVAQLIRTLEAIPDSDGRTLMDNTLIVWGGELADGWHGYEKYFMLLAGGSWAFETGRYLHHPWKSTDIELLLPFGRTTTSGTPHHHVLVSVAQAMGLALDQVGLDKIEGKNGHRVQLTGPLESIG